MTADLARLYGYRELLVTLLVRDLKVRYRQTVLGVAWALLQPASTAAVLSAVFFPFMAERTGGAAYFAFVYTGVLCWNLLAACLSFGANSLVGHASLLTKIAFPREVFPLSAALLTLLDYAVGLLLLLIVLGAASRWPSAALLVLPAVLGAELLLGCALALLLSAVNVFFRDVRFLLPLATLLWMFLTPVFYPVSRLSPSMQGVVWWNPMSHVVEMHRAILLEGRLPDPLALIGLVLGCGLVFALSYAVFKRLEPLFAEVV